MFALFPTMLAYNLLCFVNRYHNTKRRETHENVYYDKIPTVCNGLHKCGKGNGFTIDSFSAKIWCVRVCVCFVFCYIWFYFCFSLWLISCASLTFFRAAYCPIRRLPFSLHSDRRSVFRMKIYLLFRFTFFYFNVTISQFCGYVYVVSVHMYKFHSQSVNGSEYQNRFPWHRIYPTHAHKALAVCIWLVQPYNVNIVIKQIWNRSVFNTHLVQLQQSDNVFFEFGSIGALISNAQSISIKFNDFVRRKP